MGFRTEKNDPKRKEKSRSREWIETIIYSLIIALILRTFVVQAFKIPSGSMEETLLIGDLLLAEKITYRLRDPNPGDIVIFKYPLNPKKDYIKRCVAVEGQTVELKDKILYIDGLPFPDSPGVKYIDSHILPATYSNRDNFGPYKVPQDCYFMMGDNRDNSRDSRFWGPLHEKYIKAKPLFIYFSWGSDPNAPRWESPYPFAVLQIFAYNLIHFPSRIRWERIGNLIK
ncbi:signal peptidase I [bacterium]|nr:signal peptidase I [bacterium]